MMIVLFFLSGFSLSSIVGVIKQLSKVVKTSGDVITMLAKDRTDNPDILTAGKMVNFRVFLATVKVTTSSLDYNIFVRS